MKTAVFVVDELRYLPPIGSSDHVGLLWGLRSELSHQVETISPKKAYWRGDYVKMASMLMAIDWNKEFANKGVEDTWEFIKLKYDEVVDLCIPCVGCKKKKKSNFISKETLKLISRRNDLFQSYKRSGLTSHYDEYKICRNKVNKLIQRDKVNYTQKLIGNFRDSRKAFYGYVRSKQSFETKVFQLRRKSDKTLTQTDAEAGKELSEFFKSVFVKESSEPVPEFNVDSGINAQTIENIEITPAEVHRKLASLNVDKSPGPDGMHPRVLQGMANTLDTPLAMLFNKSIKDGILPEDWKCANVSSIFKKGSKLDAGNYRPVSLTSVPCKILESLIRDSVVKYMDDNEFISTSQHGFVSNRSCLTNLLETLGEWTEALDEGYGIHAIFLDYRKAFDTVPHKRLISKLKGYGVRGQLLQWIENFLTNRKMRVILNGCAAEWIEVLSGVPQGSVLGPLLFLIYVNELPKIVNSSIKMFADDTKIWKKIQNNQEDIEALQRDLLTLESWSEQWLLCFNTEKCKVMKLGAVDNGQYFLHDNNKQTELLCCENEKDLGVWISKDLKWTKQCNTAANKAMSVLGMIKRSFSHISIESFKILYNTYVRPHLEYCVQIWNPYLKKDIECIEKIQRRSTKLVHGFDKMPYEQRLKALGLYSLQRRRLRGDLIETYKILTCKEKIKSDQLFQKATTTELRGHSLKLYKKSSRLELRKHSFSQRIVDHWNKLPDDVVSAATISTFKRRLDTWMDRYGH